MPRPTEEDILGYLADVMKKIDEHGYVVQAIFPTSPGDFWFAYTVGLTKEGLPELICTGLPEDLSYQLLGATFNVLKQVGLNSQIELPSDDGDGVPIRLIPCSNAKLSVAKRMYENVLSAQVVWPDDSGRFPGDPGFIHHQPLLEVP